MVSHSVTIDVPMRRAHAHTSTKTAAPVSSRGGMLYGLAEVPMYRHPAAPGTTFGIIISTLGHYTEAAQPPPRSSSLWHSARSPAGMIMMGK
eukprot:6729465-Pyramimonas_sp.AAC.1